jgi:hypothetical protein
MGRVGGESGVGGRERERHSAKELKRKGEERRENKCEEEDREEETGKKTGER